MLTVCPVRKVYQPKIPSITNVDGSTRLQTVRADTNPRYHRLITEFGKLSGIPVLLNTSFNIMGEPVVESPLQAIRCFFSNGLDVLVMGDFIVNKSPGLSLTRRPHPPPCRVAPTISSKKDTR